MPSNDEEPPELADVTDEENVIRRFNPSNPNHVLIDEGTGERRLRHGAVSLTRDRDGCSVYRCGVLKHYGINDEAVAEAEYCGLAWFSVQAIRKCRDGLDVIPDSWPRGREAAPHRDVAHALITWSGTTSAARRAGHALAQSALRLSGA